MNLSEIKSPSDLKPLDSDQLHDIASQMRHALLDRLSRHGGHVGPNLGMVETILAMHYVFDSPVDKIIYDVSHQCYPHKMLTGRAAAYLDPAHYDDVSGYTNPAESPHDFFTVGHTSTAVSLACGLAKARDLKGDTGNIIAVVGDGSLSGGEAFEGLDNASQLHSNFIIVVNDNDMSIAENHGGLYAGLKRLRDTQGQDPCNFFISLGLDYRFVPDGNNLDSLIDTFKAVKDIDHPIVLHIVTEKGHGYLPASEHKEQFHYSGPFDLATGRVLNQGGTDYCDITGQYLRERMAADPLTVAITSGTPGVLGFGPAERLQAGAQFVDVGIAEGHAAALSSGLAKAGARPVWGVFSSFIQRTYDQISQDIAINNSPVTIAVFASSVSAMNDVTHLGIFDIAMLSNIPGIVMLAPTCRAEYLAMLTWSIEQTSHPVIIRVPAPAVYDLDIPVDTDYSDINTFSMISAGHDIALIGVGNMLRDTMAAADILRRRGYNPTVINPRYVTGLDTEMLSALSPDHTAVVTVEDGILDGGFGQKVDAFFADTPMLVHNIGLKKEFIDRYDRNDVRERAGLTPQGIADAAIDMFR